jgi:hypothetical protein
MVQSQVIKAVENKVEFMKEARMGLDIIHILEHLNISSFSSYHFLVFGSRLGKKWSYGFDS